MTVTPSDGPPLGHFTPEAAQVSGARSRAVKASETLRSLRPGPCGLLTSRMLMT